MNRISILQGAATLAVIVVFPGCSANAEDLVDDSGISALEQPNVGEQFSKALRTVSPLPLRCLVVWTAPMGNQISFTTTYTFQIKPATVSAPMEVYWFADHGINHPEMPPFTPSIGRAISTTPAWNRSIVASKRADGGATYVYNEGASTSHKTRITLSMDATNTRAVSMKFQGLAPGFSREVTRIDCPVLP
jgi:hypothetical protein